MDIDKLVEILAESQALGLVDGNKVTTNKLPAYTYLRLVVASIATNKSFSSCVMTAIETYLMRNEEKHLQEIKIQAAIAGMTLEEFLASVIIKRKGSKYPLDPM